MQDKQEIFKAHTHHTHTKLTHWVKPILPGFCFPGHSKVASFCKKTVYLLFDKKIYYSHIVKLYNYSSKYKRSAGLCKAITVIGLGNNDKL